MRRNAVRIGAFALALCITGGVLLTSAQVRAAEGEGLASLFQQLFAPQPAYTPPPPAAASPADTPLDGSYGRWQGRRPRAAGQDAIRSNRLRAQEAAKQLRTRYASLPKPEKLSGEKAKRLDERSAKLAKAGDVQAALLQDSTLRSGDIVITAAGPKVFVGREGERHRAGDFEEAGQSRRIDEKTRRLLVSMVAPRGSLGSDEARRLMAKLRRRAAEGQEVALVSRTATSPPRVISTALSQPSKQDIVAQSR